MHPWCDTSIHLPAHADARRQTYVLVGLVRLLVAGRDNAVPLHLADHVFSEHNNLLRVEPDPARGKRWPGKISGHKIQQVCHPQALHRIHAQVTRNAFRSQGPAGNLPSAMRSMHTRNIKLPKATRTPHFMLDRTPSPSHVRPTTHLHGFVARMALGTERRKEASRVSGRPGRGRRLPGPGSNGPGTMMNRLSSRSEGRSAIAFPSHSNPSVKCERVGAGAALCEWHSTRRLYQVHATQCIGDVSSLCFLLLRVKKCSLDD